MLKVLSMDNIKVSIIVPIYNVEQYCKECFDSLLKQSLSDIEVLLVNDGTKDSSGLIAKEYADKYPCIFRYFEKPNGGLSDARNYGIPHARGEYLAFVDSDDYVASTMFEKLYAKAKLENANLVECEFKYIYESEKQCKVVHFPNYKNISDCLIHAYPNAWNKIYKRTWIQSLGVIFPKGLWHEDIEFFFKILPFAGCVPFTVHEPLYFYRQREGSIMNRPNRKILDLHIIYANIFKYYSDKGLLIEYKDAIEYKYLKTTCCNFLRRTLKIKDKRFRSAIIDESWGLFIGKCPHWRRNSYLRKISLVNAYLRLMSVPFLKLLNLTIRL